VSENIVVQPRGTRQAPIFYDGPSDAKGDVSIQSRFFTYRADVGLVAGWDCNVTFRIDRPASEVWPYAKDFNLWQSKFDHYYSGVVGDLEGQTFGLSDKPDDPGLPHFYRVEKVAPEYLIVVSQPALTDEEARAYGFPGFGGVSAGFHLLLLNECGGETILTMFMEHACVMARGADADQMNDEEALGWWRDEGMAPEWLRKWRDDFIPTLKGLVYEGEQ